MPLFVLLLVLVVVIDPLLLLRFPSLVRLPFPGRPVHYAESVNMALGILETPGLYNEILNTVTLFDHEKLDVYHLELAFIGWVTTLFEELKDQKAARIAEVCDHLDRASLSQLFNTAEGNGKRQRPTRAKFFDDARGSATECAGCLDALVAKRVCRGERVLEGKQMLVRIVAMLTKLVQLYSDEQILKEDEVKYSIREEVS
jgi:four helix bundle protein